MPSSNVATHYMYENVGVEPAASSPIGTHYIFENAGLDVGVSTPVATQVIYEGDVNTDPPMPKLWFVRPESGRVGDGVVIVGMGWGATAETYDASVEMEIEGVWVALAMSGFTLVAAGAEAYTELRHIDPDAMEIDMEHNEVTVLIDDDAVPPGSLVRVKTVTP